jgi:asparagine synthase (glutamine-hydrolysing)
VCGIAGVLRWDGAPAALVPLRAMLDSLSHRGPDDEGRYVDAQLALGARRLSIIDVAAGHQPLSNEDGSVWAAFNGEIYNYRELREELLRRGHRLKTGSDTETLVHLYEDEGDGFLGALNGMFALALWDLPRRRLLLARDRLGIKPLYHAAGPGFLAFGSEPKALLASGLLPRTLDPLAVREYLQLLYVPAPRAIFEGMHKLPPGELLVCENGRVERRRYWSLPDGPPDQAPLEDQLARFSGLLKDAVALQMRSDVPYGAFLSGGIDSSGVVGTMAALSGERLRTFSIGFAASRRYDELPFARAVAQRFGTEHEEFVVEPQLFELLQELAFFYDEPFADAASLPTYVLAGLTRRKVKVVLSGDGGDELFAGYDRHRSELLAEQAVRLPEWIRRGVLQPLLGALPRPADWRLADFVRLARKKLELLALPADERYVRHFDSWSPGEFARLLGEPLRGLPPMDVVPRSLSLMQAAAGQDFINRRLSLDLQTWLPDQMLTKVDRATMAKGLEARVPLLDHRLVEFAMRLPQRSKLSLFTLKRFLRLAFRELLPREILERGKHGFEVPTDEWLRGPLRGFLEDVLTVPRIARHGFYDAAFVLELKREHLERKRNRSRELFQLLVFELWYDRWIERPR